MTMTIAMTIAMTMTMTMMLHDEESAPRSPDLAARVLYLDVSSQVCADPASMKSYTQPLLSNPTRHHRHWRRRAGPRAMGITRGCMGGKSVDG